MLQETTALTPELERVLASHVLHLTSEFRNYDVADLIALIRLEKMASLSALFEGDCNSCFKPDTMVFANHAEVLARWHRPPTVRLAMAFRHWDIELYFRLTLEASEVGVEIDLIRFEPSMPLGEERVARLDAALVDARR